MGFLRYNGIKSIGEVLISVDDRLKTPIFIENKEKLKYSHPGMSYIRNPRPKKMSFRHVKLLKTL